MQCQSNACSFAGDILLSDYADRVCLGVGVFSVTIQNTSNGRFHSGKFVIMF